MNLQIRPALLGLGLIVVPAGIFSITQFADRAQAGSAELGGVAQQERILGAEGFELTGVELQPVEPFQMRAGSQAGTSIERVALVRGAGFYGTAFGPFVTLDGVDAPGVEMLDDTTLKVYLPADLRGPVELGVRLSDGRSAALGVQL
jgi:hypothetical protein